PFTGTNGHIVNSSEGTKEVFNSNLILRYSHDPIFEMILEILPILLQLPSSRSAKTDLKLCSLYSVALLANIVLKGSPGIGKSFYLNYLFYLLSIHYRTIVCDNQQVMYYIFYPDGRVAMTTDKESAEYQLGF